MSVKAVSRACVDTLLNFLACNCLGPLLGTNGERAKLDLSLKGTKILSQERLTRLEAADNHYRCATATKNTVQVTLCMKMKARRSQSHEESDHADLSIRHGDIQRGALNAIRTREHGINVS